MEEAIVKLQNVAIFQKRNLILTHVNLKISKGEFVYLIGKTGSGKSSLLKTLYAELPLHEGEATVVGYDLKTIKEKDIPFLRRKMGIVFQDFQLLTDRSVEDNLLFVLKATGWKNKNEMIARVMEVLEEVNLSGKRKKMPTQLSGGEQQRVAIARALLNAPNIILADEPTGNLDPETSNEIMRLLKSISENGQSVLMATHNYNIIHKFPARIIKCDEGTITAASNQSGI
ncbi:MAG: ATP-binding cassette domain-containing protein [Lentimicrobiaceae bacterium]|jgi:cell division transport system ATP-binding protein|nr:ATP-binding cassette domain-containing protein [Lentimicrobiaceae bacterium]